MVGIRWELIPPSKRITISLILERVATVVQVIYSDQIVAARTGQELIMLLLRADHASASIVMRLYRSLVSKALVISHLALDQKELAR